MNNDCACAPIQNLVFLNIKKLAALRKNDDCFQNVFSSVISQSQISVKVDFTLIC